MRFDFLNRLEHNFKAFKNIPFLPNLIDEQLKIITLFTNPEKYNRMIVLIQYLKNKDGINTCYHKYGGIEFLLNKKELGHIHGNGLVDWKVSKEIRDEFLSQKMIEEHHVLKNEKWISCNLNSNEKLNIMKNICESMLNLNRRKNA